MASCTDALTSTHDAFVELLRRLPHIVAEALARARGQLPEGEVVERHPNFEVPGLVRRARKLAVDLLLAIRDRKTERIILAVLIEFQDSVDTTKRFVWPLAVSACAAELRTRGEMAIFAVDPAVIAWIERLLPKLEPRPTLIEARHIDLILDLNDARTRPLETVFAALYHARSETPIEDRLAGIRAGIVALRELGEVEGQRYDVLMLNVVPAELGQRALRELRDEGILDDEGLVRISAFERQGYSFNHGLEEGREEGRRAGLAEGRQAGLEEGLRLALAGMKRALVDVLGLRGFSLSDGQRRLVADCDDLQRVERWYEAAKTIDAEDLGGLLA